MGGVDGVAYGENPGVNAGGTVYFFGHSATTRTGVFDKLPKLKKGDKAEVETDYGVITYVVDELLYIPKDEYTKTDKITEQTPGRLLLVSCDQAGPQYSNGYSKDNLVAVLHVEGARAL
ncbi:MAG: class F sortase [Propionibacteriaceae bacterium]|nr:class F sortase [Propionibacteriaceae bacterium]